jgi:hypothetical protein
VRRYLVVANRTLGGDALLDKVRELAWHGPCAFHIVVPATPPQDHLTWTEGTARAGAEERLNRALEAFRSIGAQATGEVGDWRPMNAVLDAVREQAFDDVIVSTLPQGVSRWLRQDLPHRISRVIGRPVIHVVATPEPARR